MQTVAHLFDQLWLQYTAINPQAEAIHRLLSERGEHVVNDHIAIRTFDTDKLGIDKIAQVFIDLGYQEKGQYDFTAKKLNAHHFEHQSDPNHPKVFISELQVAEFSDEVQNIIHSLDEQVTASDVYQPDFIYSGRPWSLTFEQYIRLLQESEYAAWTAAFGYRANHFTVSINHLTTFFDIETLNQFIIDNGFAMNESGGLIKGTPAQKLEQSSTMAPLVNLAFDDASHLVPSCFYEFAKRYPMDSGRLYQGFIAASADKIFESTDTM